MYDFWISIISGGFAGGGVVALLSKLLIENKLKQSVQKSQHELDVKKDSLQLDLSLYAHQQNLKYSRYDEFLRQAIEKIFIAVISTSFLRGGFNKYQNLGTIQETENFVQHILMLLIKHLGLIVEFLLKLLKQYTLMKI